MMSMEIVKVDIENFRALKSVSVPLQRLSILIGENDVGKTSFLYALENFFVGKKLTNPKDWYKNNTNKPIRVTVTFKGHSDNIELIRFQKSDKTIAIKKIFECDKKPDVLAILDDRSAIPFPKSLTDKWFSQNSFHLIPVRRDLAVQFSMNKTAMLGKLLRAKMRLAINEAGAGHSLNQVKSILQEAISAPRESMQSFLREQLSNDAIQLGFDDLDVDPTEGVRFSVTLSDDRVQSIDIQDRGAGTQNNLIIALFRLIAGSNVEGNFIFAMEEPENSLHPKAQRQLLNVIQEISCLTQVIVTTHSPVFIDRSKFESNILLTRTLSGNTVAKVFDKSQLAQLRTDLGIRASDALLKGGGNCAILVEGKTEEDAFPVFMEMMGLSDFELGIAIINMGGSDREKVKNIVRLLNGYNIPCVVVLDKDAQKTADDLNRMLGEHLNNLRKVFCLEKGTIEDYFPPSIVAQLINQELSPETPVTERELDKDWSGKDRLNGYKKIMYDHGAGESIEYLKTLLGQIGARMLKDKGIKLNPEIIEILNTVENIVRNEL
jgi:predicted ATP-dependent endonuclease of OLD family